MTGEIVKIEFTINGVKESRYAQSDKTLLRFIREDLRLTGTKSGCDEGECGACMVLINNKPINSCMVLAPEIDGKELVTIEGLSQNGELDRVQKAFVEHSAVQCGYCTPGMVMSAKALLDRNPSPSDEEIKKALNGNLCRCGTYQDVKTAIRSVSK